MIFGPAVGVSRIDLNRKQELWSTAMNTQRAATTRLEPGEHSIDRANPRRREDKGVYWLDWSIRLSDGRMLNKRSQGVTVGEVKRRAKASAKELLTTGGGVWKTSSKFSEYLNQVSRSAIEKAKLRPNSQTRYLLALSHIAGDCTAHGHTESLKGHSLGSGTTFRALENCLLEIAILHGAESSRQARSVLSKYVVQQLIRDGVLDHNPLAGMSIDLKSEARPHGRTQGGQALKRSEYNAVLDYLLNLDPAKGQTKPSRGRWSLEDRVAKRRNIIDLTLLQASTGLRVSEANAISWGHIETADNGVVHVRITEEISKTHKGRSVPIMDEQVAERILARQNAAKDLTELVIGSPADPTTIWDRDNCRKTAAQFYAELAEALGIELLSTARTHVWRATLNSLTLGDVPEVTRAALFGHDVAVNRAAYTDLSDTSSMVSAVRRLRAV